MDALTDTQKDASVWSNFLTWLSEHYHTLDTFVRGSDWVLPILLILVLLLLWKTFGKKVNLNSFVTLPWSLGRAVKAWFEGRAMRKKRAEELVAEAKNTLMDFIDAKVEAKEWSTADANGVYRHYRPVHWDFKNCIVKLSGRQHVQHDLATSKDADGKIIPAPIPA